MSKNQAIIDFIKNKFFDKNQIPLHEPKFIGNEKKYVLDTIDTSYVSSVGNYVNKFEKITSKYLNTLMSIATVNGTSALQVALKIIGVKHGDEVITQALTFIATANSIIYNGASPIFIDVDIDTMGLSPKAVEIFLEKFGEVREDGCYNKMTNKKISACVPMHTFGFPVHLNKLIKVCKKWKIPIIEDAAEALGSSYNSKKIGSFGALSIFSFNGNKIITSGGGGLIVTNNKTLGKKCKHLTTTAKKSHPYEFIHDEIGYNFRMPNINAALACAQMENLNKYLKNKRELAIEYEKYFNSVGIKFRKELPNTKANYWLMCIELANKRERDLFLKITNKNKIFTRPIWRLIHKNKPYKKFQTDSQVNATFLEKRIVNIPSNI